MIGRVVSGSIQFRNPFSIQATARSTRQTTFILLARLKLIISVLLIGVHSFFPMNSTGHKKRTLCPATPVLRGPPPLQPYCSRGFLPVHSGRDSLPFCLVCAATKQLVWKRECLSSFGVRKNNHYIWPEGGLTSLVTILQIYTLVIVWWLDVNSLLTI